MGHSYAGIWPVDSFGKFAQSCLGHEKYSFSLPSRPRPEANADDGYVDAESVQLIDAAIRSNLFWTDLKVIDITTEVLEVISTWAESCA
eukprot:2155307-Alexandrium_andersonii.AAC.1